MLFNFNEQKMNEEQCSNRLAWHILNSYPTRSLRQYLAYESQHNTEEAQAKFKQVQIEAKDHKKLKFQIQVEIGDGRSEVILVDDQTDINRESQLFCKKYKLDSNVSELLAHTIREKYESQLEQTLNQSIAKEIDSLTEFYSNPRAKEVLINSNDIETSRKQNQRQSSSNISKHNQQKGASKILKNYYSKSKKYSLSENYLLENKENQPQINKISQQICEKLGKENIIEQKNKKSREKYMSLLKQKQQKQEQLMLSCPFKPKINAISKQVDREIFQNRQEVKLQRFRKLHDNYKQIEMKKEQQRQNYFMKIPFKPIINEISRKIMQSKKPTNWMESQEKRQKKQAKARDYSSNKSLPHTGRAPLCRNLQNLPIGDYLYNRAMKKSKPKAVLQKCQIKALDHSDYLISVLKEKRINQIFTDLTNAPHQQLYCEDISLSENTQKLAKYKYFIPIFNEMMEMDISITREQFLDAALKLFKLFSPEQKYEIIFKKQKQQHPSQVQHSLMNSKSKSIFKRSGFDKADIYNRGIQHLKHIQQRIERNREDKVRDELRQCTFKPMLNQFM